MFLCTCVQLYNERFIFPVCFCVLVYSSATKGLLYQYVFVYLCTALQSITKSLFYQYGFLFFVVVVVVCVCVYWYAALQLKVYFTSMFLCTGIQLYTKGLFHQYVFVYSSTTITGHRTYRKGLTVLVLDNQLANALKL